MQDEICLIVAGLHDDGCARRAAMALTGVHGVLATRASHASGMVAVSYDPAELVPAMLVERLEKAGFTLADTAVDIE